MIRIMKSIILLIIIILQSSCYASGYQTVNENPILQLEEKYAVYLDYTWTAKHAETLLRVFKSISPWTQLHFSQWHISNSDLDSGIKIEFKDKLKFVTISRNILPVEGAQKVSSPSKHLYYAVFEFITDNGTNKPMIEFILKKRYGIEVPSYGLLSNGLAAPTEKRYSDFENEDLMLIISVLEEFPQAFHKTAQLKYIVRRIDNHNRGISQAIIGGNRIEFAESIFGRHNFNDTRRVIAHEKSHFLWAYVFNQQIKTDWTKLGGWHQDSNSESGWSTTKKRSEFVSDYAYEVNPNEDMAESIAHYIVDPDKLRYCSPNKYKFIHEQIMLMYGERYAPSNLM